jgi:hypothetical protein
LKKNLRDGEKFSRSGHEEDLASKGKKVERSQLALLPEGMRFIHQNEIYSSNLTMSPISNWSSGGKFDGAKLGGKPNNSTFCGRTKIQF